MGKKSNRKKTGNNNTPKSHKKSSPIIPIALAIIALIVVVVLIVNAATEDEQPNLTEQEWQGQLDTVADDSTETEPPATDNQQTPDDGWVFDGEQNPIATIEMADGQIIKIELLPNMAPNTVTNFIYLANQGFYDGVTFHRLIPGFMIQGGCPLGTGTGNPGYTIRGEFPANGFTRNTLLHERGVISMARAMPFDSAGSQFFIMHGDSPFLDTAGYASFGRVIEGIEVVDDIVMDPTTGPPSDIALEPRIIKSITVDTFGFDFGEPEKLPL